MQEKGNNSFDVVEAHSDIDFGLEKHPPLLLLLGHLLTGNPTKVLVNSQIIQESFHP